MMSSQRWRALRRQLDDPAIWRPCGSTEDEAMTWDGARWLLEYRDGEDYRVVHRHSPQAGGPHEAFRALCLEMLSASGLQVPADDIY